MIFDAIHMPCDGRCPKSRGRAAALAVVLAAALLASACADLAFAAKQTVTQAEYELFTKAQDHVKHNRFDKAEALLAGYFKRTHKRKAFGYELYGFIMLHQKKPAEAVQFMEQGVREYPDNASIVQNYGAALARTERYTQAADAYLKAYELSGDKRHGFAFSAAWMLFQDKQYPRAEAVMLDLMKHPRVRPPWYVLLAQLQLHQEKYARAQSLLEAAVDRFPDKARLWRLLGFAYFKRGDREKAVATYEIAYRLRPPNPREAKQLAALYASLGAPHMGAIKLAGHDAPPTTLDALAFCQARAGDLEAALAKADQALASNPTPERQYRKGLILLRMGRSDEAAACFREAGARKGAFQGRALWKLAMMAWSDADWDQTAANLRKAMHADHRFNKRGERILQMLDTISAQPPQKN